MINCPTHIDNDKLVGSSLLRPNIEMKPNIVAMSISIVLYKKIIKSCLLALKNTVKITSFEFWIKSQALTFNNWFFGVESG